MISGRGVYRDLGCQPFGGASPHASELTSRLADQVHVKRQCQRFGVDGLVNGWEAKWSFIRENREKTEETTWGTSDNGATTAPRQLCKVHT